MGEIGRRALAVLCAGALSCGAALADDMVRVGAGQVRALGIETAPLVAQKAATGTGLPARVVVPNGQIFMVSAPLAGLIVGMAAAVNDPVSAGEVLARLDSPGLIEAQRGFLHAAVQARLAREALRRDQQLLDEGIIARGRYLNTRASAVQAEASASEARQLLHLYGMSAAAIAALEASGRLSSTLEVRSPLDGVVLEQLATAGQRVEASAPLYKVARLDPLWLEIRVPVAQAAEIASGAAVSVPACGASGSVLSIGRQVDPANQTIAVRATVSSGAACLRPGQAVEATLQLGRSAEREWRVPAAALVRREEQAYLFVQVQDGFRAVPVAVVNQSANAATVTGALRGDERIAVKGLAALKASWTGIGRGQ